MTSVCLVIDVAYYISEKDLIITYLSLNYWMHTSHNYKICILLPPETASAQLYSMPAVDGKHCSSTSCVNASVKQRHRSWERWVHCSVSRLSGRF